MVDKDGVVINAQMEPTDGTKALPVVPQATVPKPVPSRAGLAHPSLFFNRELSWLDFNWRVLHQAMDERTPLLERVRFLAITANNLDEFFRKRIGGLKRQIDAGVVKRSPDGRTPQEQFELGRKAVRPMCDALTQTWEQEVKPLLRERLGIHIRDYAELTDDQQKGLHNYFMSSIFPILTPLAVDPGHPFPFISNLSLSLAVTLRHPTRLTEHFARLKVPYARGRWVPINDEPMHFVPLEQVIKHNICELFRGMEVTGVYVFRITRNADVRRDEEEADDLISLISDELRERRFSYVVRAEVESGMPCETRELLMRELGLEADDLYEVEGLIDLSDASLANLNFPDHQFPCFDPVTPTPLLHEGEAKDRPDVFSVIRRGEMLVHHPYESFTASTQRLIEEAAEDAKVLAIKQTLYRTSDESPIVNALVRAAERGKQVAVLVEVKARFDEKNNIEWGQLLEKSGVHVTYGLVGLKTHTKTTLIIRQEEEGLRAYCHIGTGNYNPNTARLYTDFGLLTCDPDIGYDLINLFHYLTGYSPVQHYRRLVVAPRDMRRTFVRLIRGEIEHQKQSGNGRIIAKMNALDDIGIIQELYRASKAGVQIDLIVRGHCRLRPGLPRISENIRVLSIVGRFLEHSRIFYFHNNEMPRVYIGSADWMRRNLDDRVEAVIEVIEPSLHGRLVRTLKFALDDQCSAWDLDAGGRYTLRMPRPDQPDTNFQSVLMQRARNRTLRADTPWDIG